MVENLAHSANTELQTTKADLEQAKAKIKVLKRKLAHRNKAAGDHIHSLL